MKVVLEIIRRSFFRTAYALYSYNGFDFIDKPVSISLVKAGNK